MQVARQRLLQPVLPRPLISLTVTDAHNCTTTASVTITGHAVLAVSGTQTNLTCNGGSNGSIDITVTGGTGTYSYSWSNGYNAQDPSGLTAGTYTVIVTDANGCTATATYTLTQPAAVTLTASGITNTQCNAYVGAVTLTGSGTGTVSLNGGAPVASPATYTTLAAGYYTATFTVDSYRLYRHNNI